MKSLTSSYIFALELIKDNNNKVHDLQHSRTPTLKKQQRQHLELLKTTTYHKIW